MEACCIIKPEALGRRVAIMRAFASADLPVREQRRIIYTECLLNELYDHMSSLARARICMQMRGMPGVALRVETPSVLRLLAVAGTQSDPRRCAPESIRFRFGIHGDPEQADGWEWWENAIHRPVNMREAARDMRLIFPS